jgi:hypothetical protein
MGQVVFASNQSTTSNLTYQSGPEASVRAQFASHGVLTSSTPTFTSGNVISLSYDLGTTSNSATFAIGYVREKAINYLRNPRTHYYQAFYPSPSLSVVHFLDDYASALLESKSLDASLVQKATAAAGSNYSDILTLTPRQVYGTTDLTIPLDTLNISDVMVFMKEISSDGNVNTSTNPMLSFRRVFAHSHCSRCNFSCIPDILCLKPRVYSLAFGAYPAICRGR